MKMKWIAVSICLLIVIAGVAMLRPGGPAVMREFFAEPDSNPDHKRINSQPLKLPLVDPKIEVTKNKRELLLYSEGQIVRVYRVGLGTNPIGDKVRQGDGRTPEGEFYVCSKNPKSSYYLALGLSYPNEKSAERGLREGLITKFQRDQIVQAIRSRGVPPWNTRLGGEVFIHGHGSSSDWTLGCVALDNADIKELYDTVPRLTQVVIKP